MANPTPRQELANSPHRYLLDEPDFKRWFNNVKRGSILTAHEWVRRFGLIHRKFGKSPTDIAAMNAKQAGNFLLDIADTLEAEGKSGSYISNCIKPVKNWLSFNDIYVQKKIKISNKHKLTKVDRERVPTPDELRKIIGAGDFRSKTMCGLMAFCGLRPETFGDYTAQDGLTIGDFPEMSVNNKQKLVEFKKIPTTIFIRSSLSKTKKQYFVFLVEEGCEYVKSYLESRMAKGEKLEAETPIITQTKLYTGSFMRTGNLSEYIKIPIKKAGYGWRPYVLRRYFDTRMMLAESEGIIIRDWRVFWMGHVGNIDAEYTVNKGLSEDVMEKMREKYAKAADMYLITSRKHDVNIDTIKAQFNSQFLEIAGYSTEEIERLGDLSNLSPDDINRLIQEKSRRALGLNGNSQKVVPMQQVKQYIENGWEYVKDLAVDEAIVKLPLQ